MEEYPRTQKCLDGFASATKFAWECAYRGDRHEIMLEKINAMERSSICANCTLIIQSSGTGKSRMVDEMAKLVFTIPLNLRNPDESRGEAFPPGDRCVWQYLCKSDKVDINVWRARARLFFKILLAELTAEVKRVFSGRENLTPCDLAQLWRNHLSQLGIRSCLYAKVINACNKKIDSTYSDSTSLARTGELRHGSRQLLDTLNSFCNFPESNDIQLLLYFDEAHELQKYRFIRDYEGGPNGFDTLWSILGDFGSQHVVTVFLSAQPYLNPTPPTSPISRSSRLLCPPESVAPFTAMPFDCHPSFPLGPTDFRLKEVSDIPFLMRFGRPWFWAMFESNKDSDQSELLDNILDLARQRLVRHDYVSDPMGHSRVARLAVLDVLISVDYDPREDLAHESQIDMIANHMRIAFMIPANRSHPMWSGYPPEPFIAEAASRQAHLYSKNGFGLFKILKENFVNGLINLDRRGEVVMRLLVRQAYMDAIVTEQKVNGDASPNFSKGCLFPTFLKALFAKGCHGLLLQSKPDDKAATPITLEDAFKNAVVRFTNFIRAANDAVMTINDMAMAFVRGTAIMGCDHQDNIALAIPILLDKDAVIRSASMSVLLIQVKQHSRRTSADTYFGEKLCFFSEQDTRPYITLVAHLGAPEPVKSNMVVGKPGRYSLEHITSKSMPGRPRYSIQAYGCTDRTWNVGPDEAAYYAHVFSLDEVFPDHPRQDEETLRLVHRMRPFSYEDAAWCVPAREDDARDADADEEEENVSSVMD